MQSFFLHTVTGPTLCNMVKSKKTGLQRWLASARAPEQRSPSPAAISILSNDDLMDQILAPPTPPTAVRLPRAARSLQPPASCAKTTQTATKQVKDQCIQVRLYVCFYVLHSLHQQPPVGKMFGPMVVARVTAGPLTNGQSLAHPKLNQCLRNLSSDPANEFGGTTSSHLFLVSLQLQIRSMHLAHGQPKFTCQLIAVLYEPSHSCFPSDGSYFAYIKAPDSPLIHSTHPIGPCGKGPLGPIPVLQLCLLSRCGPFLFPSRPVKNRVGTLVLMETSTLKNQPPPCEIPVGLNTSAPPIHHYMLTKGEDAPGPGAPEKTVTMCPAASLLPGGGPHVAPSKGRGAGLLTHGDVEANPGPGGSPAATRFSSLLFDTLQQKNLLDHFDIEPVDVESGPCSIQEAKVHPFLM